MPRQASPADRRNASVGKAAAVLRAAAAHPDGASVTRLARDAGLPRATALRMIEALEAERLLSRLRDEDRVLLGPGLYELAAAGDQERPLVEAARGPMRRLADATGEAITLAVRRGDRILGIDGAAVGSQQDMVSRLNAAGQRTVIDLERAGRFTRLTLESR